MVARGFHRVAYEFQADDFDYLKYRRPAATWPEIEQAPTTIEEVRDVHTKTLKLAVETTNAQFEDYEESQRLARQAEREQQAAHQRNIREVASEIQFD